MQRGRKGERGKGGAERQVDVACIASAFNSVLCTAIFQCVDQFEREVRLHSLPSRMIIGPAKALRQQNLENLA